MLGRVLEVARGRAARWGGTPVAGDEAPGRDDVALAPVQLGGPVLGREPAEGSMISSRGTEVCERGLGPVQAARVEPTTEKDEVR